MTTLRGLHRRVFRALRQVADAPGYARVWLFTVFLAACAIAVTVTGIRPLVGLDAPFHLHVLVLAGLYVLSEAVVVHLSWGRDAHTYSLSEIALVLGLFFVSPLELMAAQFLGNAVALGIHRRQSPTKLAFNLANFSTGTALAILTFRAFVPTDDPTHVLGLIGAITGTIVMTLFGDAAIMAAISLSEGRFDWRRLPELVGPSMLGAAGTSMLALAGVRNLWTDPSALVLLILPLALMMMAFRAYVGSQEQYQSLMFIHQSSRLLTSFDDIEPAVQALLTEVRETFRADVAELTLFPGERGEQALRIRMQGDEAPVVSQASAGSGGLAKLIAHIDGVMVWNARTRATDTTAHTYLTGRGFKDAMVAPLRGERRTYGAFVLGDRLGDVSTFDDDDAKLFEVLSSQVASWVENGRLEQSLVQLTELQARLQHQAYHDALTGLPNRALFTERVEEALERPDDRRAPVAVLFLDLDDFKNVNDTLGHEAGDELLRTAAARIRGCIRSSDTAARLGGDEFAILVEGLHDREQVVELARRILAELGQPFALIGTQARVNVSIGIAFDEGDGIDASRLLRNADAAMYESKRSGKGRYELYRAEVHAAMLSRLASQDDLRRAVERDELTVHYQPLITMDDGRIVGFEALARWPHPERGMVSPTTFIPLAEETGLIVSIGQQILREACQQAKSWIDSPTGSDDLFVSVNLSARQVAHPELVDQVIEAVQSSGIAPSNLLLEVTESVLMVDTDANAATLAALREMGVRIAIDDFGTGFSSLAYLRRFPIDVLKIAREFVDELGQDADADVFVRAIVELGNTLNLQTVAEGIEHRRQHDLLRELGCDLGQGFLFSKPMDPDGIDALLRDHRRLAVETAATNLRVATASAYSSAEAS